MVTPVNTNIKPAIDHKNSHLEAGPKGTGINLNKKEIPQELRKDD